MSKSATLPKLIIALIIVGVTVYFCQAQRGTPVLKGGNFREVLTIDNAPIKRDSGPLKSYSDVIERIEPAVVKISTAQEVYLRRYRSPYSQDPFLRRFLGIEEDTGTVERRKQPLGLGPAKCVWLTWRQMLAAARPPNIPLCCIGMLAQPIMVSSRLRAMNSASALHSTRITPPWR